MQSKLPINNHRATELIKRLYKKKNNEIQIIEEAFQIYNEIHGTKNHIVINELLQLCLRLKQQHKILLMWKDIINIKSGINYTLLFKCCLSIPHKSITVLEWMKYNNYTLQKHEIKDHSMNIVKLIGKNKNNIDIIKQIHCSLLTDDIFIKTALMSAYGECRNIIAAEKVFKSIAMNKRDSIAIGVLMKILIKNECNDKVLSFYFDAECRVLNNDVTHMYALQACINMNYYQKGLQIIACIEHNNKSNKSTSHQLQNTMVNFYGNFGDINNALKIFNNTNNYEIINVNVMLKSYVNNEYNKECVLLYDKYNRMHLTNDISHTLALKAAINLKDYKKCKAIHESIADIHQLQSIELCSTLIDFYGQIGDICTAKKIFESIKVEKHTVVSIGCMIKILNLNECYSDAIALYDDKRFAKLQNDICHLYAIKACIEINRFEKGKEIHANIVRMKDRNINNLNIKLLNSLIDFYGYFGDIENALAVFDGVSDDKKDFVSIGSMMNALLINDKSESVIALYDKYRPLMDDTSFALLFKACINSKNFEKGQTIYYNVITHRQNINISLYNTLIDFFGSFNDITQATHIFDNVPCNAIDVVTVGTIMKIYINNEESSKALLFYDKYELLQDNISHTLAIRASKNMNDFAKGKEIHDKIAADLNDADIQCYNTLIDFYCHFADIFTATQIFNGISENKINSQTINIIMKAYIKCKSNYCDKALIIYDRFHSLSNDISHLYAIKACILSDNFEKGQFIYDYVTNNNALSDTFDNIILKNAFIELYGHFNKIDTAIFIFDSINECEKDTTTVNALIKCLVSNENTLTLTFYRKYYELTDDFSHILALKSCKRNNNKQFGFDIYEETHKNATIMLENAFIDFFGYFGDINFAIKVFENVVNKDSATINSMISVFGDCQRYCDCIAVYDKNEMFQDDISHLLIINICAKSDNFEKGKEIYLKIKDLDKSIALQNTLIDFFGTFGCISSSLSIFNSIPNETKDIYSIGVMMNAYCNCKMYIECIKLFENIENYNANLEANVVCYSNLFKACTQSTAYHFGKQIHEKLEKKLDNKWMLSETEIQITLINMYGKCSMLNVCNEIFNPQTAELGVWNAIIYAHGRNGFINKALELFDIMRNERKLSGDYRTFIVLINGCSHSGNIEEARDIWENKIGDITIKYNKNVITSIIDCYSRGGYLNEAYKIIKQYYVHNSNMYNNEDVTMFMALLSGCKKFENYQLTQTVYKEMEKHFKTNESYMASASTILSNMYGAN